MTLRLRLTLVTTLVVVLVLAVSGVALHVLLANRLQAGLDDSLQQASGLLLSGVEQDEDHPTLHQQGEQPPNVRADLSAVLISASGHVLDQLGSLPEPLPRTVTGFSTQGEVRVYTQRVGAWAIVTMRNLEDVQNSVARFDLSFALLAPAALLFAFALSYGLARQALLPVDRLTRSALELAERRAWRERLPVPARRDELWRLSQATNLLLGTLADVIESERRFTADAAHELRTPLTVLQGRLEKALDTTDPTRSRASVEKAHAASRDLGALVETLLSLARSDAGQHPLTKCVVLNDVARDVAEAFEPLFKQKGLGLVLELPPGQVGVRGDANTLRLALRNLLENALKFTPTGCVTLKLWTDGDLAHLAVKDTGPGIPAEALPHLFERFYQADVRHRQQGSGLGLALVRSIVGRHGGEVSAANLEGGGACVGFTLPLGRASSRFNPTPTLSRYPES